MNALNCLLAFIHAARGNDKITAMHISLFLAIFEHWVAAECPEHLSTSRRTLMATAKIKSIASYHSVLKALCLFKYISYVPSYHPGYGSRIKILLENKEAILNE